MIKDDKARFDLRVQRYGPIMLVAAGVLGVLAVVSYLHWDLPTHARLVEQPNRWHAIGWVEALRQLGKAWVVIWLLLLWALVSNRPRPATVAIFALIAAMVIVLPTKSLVKRLRPNDALAVRQAQIEPDKVIPSGHSYSFPSGDTATVFVVAAALLPSVTLVEGGLLFLIAAAVGMLRVTVQAHYPSDVLAGAAVGILCAVAVLVLCRRYLSMNWWRQNPWWRWAVAGTVIAMFPIVHFAERTNPLWTFLQTLWWTPIAIYGLHYFLKRRVSRTLATNDT